MKKLFFAFVAATLLASCSGGPEYQVSGKLDDVADQDLCLMFLVKDFTRCDHCDTLHVDANGEFGFDNVNPDIFGQILITTFNPDGSATYDPYILLPVLPKEYVRITGTLSEPVYSGSKFYQQMQEYEKLVSEPLDRINAAVEDYRAKVTADPENSDVLMSEYEDSVEEVYAQYYAVSSDYIKNHPSDDFSGYLTASQSDMDAFNAAFDALDESVRTGVMSPYIEYMRDILEEAAARKAAMGHVEDGEEAPDFTLKTIGGEDFTLSSLRGKYVMIDFWGSWCSWCIKGIPTLKEIYAKYSSKLEIVSIACNDKEENWRKAVEENDLTWVQVMNTDDANPVDARYGVEGYPTFVVVDPQGVVLKQFVGESDEFVLYMNNLLK